MELYDKAQLITDLVMQYGSDKDWADYFMRNDIGPFLSICVASGLVYQLSAEGEATIVESFDDLIRVANADPNEDYTSLDTLLGIDRADIDLDDLKWEE